MSAQKKVINLRKGVLPDKQKKKFHELLRKLYDIDPLEYVPSNIKYVCFNETCILHGGLIDNVSLNIIYENTWIGLYVKKVIVPSIPLIHKIYGSKGYRAALVAKEQGIRAFLYGNDILQESVLKVIPPDLGLYAVIDPVDMIPVGFAKWNKSKRIYENIYDIGVFLRALG